ncbi:MAG: murJ, partial [Acidimicrobiales bacterium]|nr:murJ [Acidimicrobiales bacterium]
ASRRPAPPAVAASRPAAPGPARAAHQEPDPPEPDRLRRRWPRVLVALGLLLLVGGGIAARYAMDDPDPGRGLALASVVDFDPAGTDGEHPERLDAVTDGDPTTAWATETYHQPDVGAQKGGVGLIATVAAGSSLDQLSIDTPVGGWSARIYLSDAEAPPATLAGWGDPVATIDHVPSGTVRVPLEGRTGKAVLIWFIDLATNGPRDNSAQVSGLEVRGS